jgi:nuclear receptor interaction protein
MGWTARGGLSAVKLGVIADGSVRVLRCHTDRTKRIATENSPYLFLTVSEDGTVRQHDLRRPHNCRSECPEPLFRAPRNVDLYSLSVSTVTPHMFAVAGRTDCVSFAPHFWRTS